MMTAFPPIADLLPHRAPMILLNEVIEADDEMLCAEVRVDAHSTFFDPSTGMVGAWIGIEYMAQAIAALDGVRAWRRGVAVQVGFLLGSRQFEVQCDGFAAGSRLHVHVRETLLHDNGLAAFECQISDAADPHAQALARATVTVFKPHDVQQFLSTSESNI